AGAYGGCLDFLALASHVFGRDVNVENVLLQEVRRGGRRVNADRIWIEGLDGLYVLDSGRGGEALCVLQEIEGVDDVLRGEGLAVVPGGILAKVEGIGVLV